MSYVTMKTMNMSTITEQIAESTCTDALNEVSEMLIDIEKKMSFYLPHSEITTINNNSGEKNIKVCWDTLNLIKESIKYYKLTDGAFDIALGSVINEWGIFSKHEHVPAYVQFKDYLKYADSKNIIIDEEMSTVKLKYKGMKIDLGGIAKGYAAQKAIHIYKKHNIKSAMINIGGNVAILGKKKNNDLWSVGIQNPYKERGNIIGAVFCEDTNIVTSGNYVRYFDDGQNKYGHIINPKNGQPVKSKILSTTVICKDGIKADALSTALFVMKDINTIREFIKKFNDFRVILIADENKIYLSRELSKSFYLTEECNSKVYFI